MARVVLLLSVLTSLINCQPQFQQFSPPGRQFQQFQGLPQQLGGLQGFPQQLGGLQGRPQQLGRLQAGRVKFGDRTSRAQSLCTDISNCQFGYTFNTAELDTDNGESVNTQFSVAALDQLPPLTTRQSPPRLNFGPQQNAQPPQNTRQPLQKSLQPLQPLQPPQNTPQAHPSSPRRPEPQQNSLPAFPQFDLSSSKFDFQFKFPSQPALATNSIVPNPPRRIPSKPTLRATPPPRTRSTTPRPTPPPRTRSTTTTTTTLKPTTTTTDYEYEASTDTYYYDQYEESFSLHDDDVRDDSSRFYPISSDDYEYDYSATSCPGSLEECINVCVPLEDIYVYSICVKECGDRCN